MDTLRSLVAEPSDLLSNLPTMDIELVRWQLYCAIRYHNHKATTDEEKGSLNTVQDP